MNNIGFGILCFGDDYYFKGTKEKIKEFIRETGISYQKAFYEDALISLRTGVKPLVRMILPAILKLLLKKLMTYLEPNKFGPRAIFPVSVLSLPMMILAAKMVKLGPLQI
mgnify:CR=1 FL=1